MKYNKYTVFFLIFPTLLGLLVLCSSFKFRHRYYFSLTEVKVNTDKKTLELSSKLFTDDIEDALLKRVHRKIDLANSKDNPILQKEVMDYLHERLKISINGIPVLLEWVGFETENDITWIYLEAKVNVDKKAAVKMKITNTVLYDFLPDQTNVIEA